MENLLMNCLLMNPVKLSQECPLTEQPNIGQVIIQDFLGILLNKLSGNEKTLPVQDDVPKEKQPESAKKQNDQPAGDINDKTDLLLLQAWLLWQLENTGPLSTQQDPDQEEEAGGYLDSADLLKVLKGAVETGAEIHFTGKPDNDSGPASVNVIDKAKQDIYQAGAVPVEPALEKQRVDCILSTLSPGVMKEDKMSLIPESDTNIDTKVDYKVFFHRKNIETMHQGNTPGKIVISDKSLFITPGDTTDDFETPFLKGAKVTETISHGDMPEKIKAVPANEQESTTIKNESNPFQRGDYLKAETLHGKDGARVADKMAFGSIIADRVEQVVEQYANKNSSIDMVVRLKIDEKETILVGLKDEGQKITVQIKTGNEGIMSFIQSQKDAIMKHLEGKNIYATIMVDVNDQRGFEKRDRHERKEESSQNEKTEEFSAYLDALA